MLTETQIRSSMIEQLSAKNMLAPIYLDKVDEYCMYWNTLKKLDRDIDERGVRITVSGGNGYEKEMMNECIRELPKLTNSMLSILKTLGLQEPTVVESGDGSDYM